MLWTNVASGLIGAGIIMVATRLERPVGAMPLGLGLVAAGTALYLWARQMSQGGVGNSYYA
jgi:hypothetical protein